jgi:flagellar hook-length control protein FliK
VKSAQPEKMTADQTSSDVAKTQTAMQMQDTAGVQTMAHAADVTSETSYISVDTMDLLEQVAEQIRVNVSQGTSSMEMQLNPENLGKVYVNISSKEGMIHAQLAASNEAVRAALETQVADLRQNLNQAGVKVDAIEVTVASHEFEKNLEQNQENEKQQGERQQEQSGGRRRNLNLSSLDGLSGLMTEEETLAAQMMRENGNSMDVTA